MRYIKGTTTTTTRTTTTRTTAAAAASATSTGILTAASTAGTHQQYRVNPGFYTLQCINTNNSAINKSDYYCYY